MLPLEPGQRRPRGMFVYLECPVSFEEFHRTGSINLMPAFVECFDGLLLPGLAVLTASYASGHWHISADIRRADLHQPVVLPERDIVPSPVGFVLELVRRCLDPDFAESLGVFTDTALDLFAEAAASASTEVDIQVERYLAATRLVKDAALQVASAAEARLVTAVIGELKSVESPEPDAGSAWNFHRQLAETGSDHPLYETAMDLLAGAIRRQLKTLSALDCLGVVLANSDAESDWEDTLRDHDYTELDALAADFMKWHGDQASRTLARDVQRLAARG